MNEKNNIKPIRPFVLDHEDAENRIFNAVSESSKVIPFCSLESILTNILHQVRERAREEKEYEAARYNEALEEYNKKAEKKGETRK